MSDMQGDMEEGLTRVAEIPGYPTRKLLFGGPETRTKAVIVESDTSYIMHL